MKITPIQGIEGDVTKALSQYGTSFELEDFTGDVIERRPSKPKFLSTLLVGLQQQRFMDTNTFKYDAFEHTSVLPSGIQASGFGARVNKDKAETYRWEIPYFGISGNVAVEDYANKRLPGTQATPDNAMAHMSRMERKMTDAWELFGEQQAIKLITTDSNDVAGGPFTSFNFYTEIVGGSRTAADITFSVATDDVFEQMRTQKKLLKEEMIRAGEVGDEFVCVCGGNFFQKALDREKNESLARPLKGSFDFASEEVGTETISESFKVDNFLSENCGIRFVEYSIDIGGATIGADDAYLIPIRAENFILKAYAPALDSEYVNTTALPMYAWSDQHRREGITRWEQSNYLMAMTNPRLMRKMTTA